MTRAHAVIPGFAEAHVVVAGDVMPDRYVIGSVARISPEAPVPVLREERSETMLGGAGNVVRNISSLGGSSVLLSVVGADAVGRRIEDLLGSLPGTRSALVRESGRTSTVKTRFIAERQHVLRVDYEKNDSISQESCREVLDRLPDLMTECGIVILSDYGKGLLTPGITSGIIELAREMKRPVLVDPKGSDYSRYRQATVLTPHLKELREATRHPAESDDGVAEAARRLIETCGIESVVATRGAEGMTVVQASGEVAHLRAEDREVFDVSGAGDTVVATLGLALASGATLLEAAQLANTAAGIVVGKVGTAVATPAEMLHALHRQEFSAEDSKIVTLAEARERVAVWRRKGLRIGLTNGVFDLLHHGHLNLLKQAASSCDRLIVGINGDQSVRRLRGEDAIQSDSTRSAILGSLEMVDLVIVFQEDTPLPLLEELRPDVLIKGSNYEFDKVVGADVVRAYGGRVVLAEIADHHALNGTLSQLTKGVLYMGCRTRVHTDFH